MCAECHSTNVALGYDLDNDTFSTSFSEISVGCEACHGQGSTHVALASDGTFDQHFGLPVNLDDRRGKAWIMNPETGIAMLDAPAGRQQQPESCGRCHARRSVLAAEYQYGRPLTDTHMPSLLEENLYFADGRILDEVYVFGSFVQSKMYAAGVTCSDCHDPHSARLRTGPDPNAACAQCHLPATFATTGHSGTTSTACVDCHMPARTYMGVDDRRDHSFRIPGTAGDEKHYGAAIAAGRAGTSNPLLLDRIANLADPPIARATMLTLLSPSSGEAELAVIENGINDPDPLVRIGTLRLLHQYPPELRPRAGSHLLRDPVRGVRVEAALTYVDVRDLLPLEDARAFAGAADEYREAQLNAASRPEAMVVLGEFESQMGDGQAAGRYFGNAIRLDPDFAAGHHAYGLFLVRSGRRIEALRHIRLAAELEADNPRYVYVLGVALNSIGRGDEAIAVLEQARIDFPSDFDIAWGLATMLRDGGELEQARRLVDEMSGQFPDRGEVRALRNALSTP